MAKILSQGIALSVKKSDSEGDYTVIPGLLEVPDIGGTTEKIDVTTLADTSRQYINGIKDYGELTFKFLYDGLCCKDGMDDVSNYQFLYDLFEGRNAGSKDEPKNWKLQYKSTSTRQFNFTFKGYGALSMDSASVNSALTFTLTITLASDITYDGDIAG